MHCNRDLSHQPLLGFIFLFKLFLSLFFCLLSPWDAVLGAREGSGWMILMKIFLTALQECILPQPCIDRHSGHGDPTASMKKDYGRTSMVVQLSCAPCQLQRCSPMVFSIGDVHWGTTVVIPTNLLIRNTSEKKPPTHPDRRAANSSLHFASVFSSSQDSVVAVTHWRNSVIFNPFNISLFKSILARGPHGGWMAGSL